jgi:hypothetical protein
MDKKILGVLVGIIIIGLFVFSYMIWFKKGASNLPGPNGGAEFGTVNPIENMPEINPFATDVNPMEGYKNPFEE